LVGAVKSLASVGPAWVSRHRQILVIETDRLRPSARGGEPETRLLTAEIRLRTRGAGALLL
jgi:hypothetical protein